MSKLINEVVSTSIKTDTLPSSTDDVVSTYENRIKRSIATKVLSSQYSSDSPLTLTNEEMAYLRKNAVEESSFSEVKVITPDPTITLKKGNTEINIKNAATLVKKMEEIYPSPNKTIVDSEVDDPAQKLWRRAIITNDKDDRVEIIENPNFVPAGISIVPSETKSVNKNAYEIRADILSQALAWVQYKGERSNTSSFSPSDEEVLTTAQKFYKFVENKR